MLIRLMGEMGGLKDLMLIGSTLLIPLVWKELIRLPIYQWGFQRRSEDDCFREEYSVYEDI